MTSIDASNYYELVILVLNILHIYKFSHRFPDRSILLLQIVYS